MRAALTVEWWKVRRAPVTLTATLLMVVLIPLMGLGFYMVARNGGSGPLAGKAAALLTAEGWEGYLALVGQIAAVAVFLGSGVVVAWVFGREHADRTFPALFARPTSKGSIAGAKFVVLGVWAAALAVSMCLVACALGLIAGITPSNGSPVTDVARLLGVALAAATLGLTMGYVASLTRGYLGAIGAMIVIIAVSQAAVLFGTGGWFPYAVPGLVAASGSEVGAPSLAQVLLVPIVTGTAIWLTISWWRRAEVV